MSDPTRWGVCATIKAEAEDILQFAAHYLEAGAHRVWVHLDEPNPAAHDALKAHPKCRVIDCDAAYWKRTFGRRPRKHQVRQTQNASRTYSRAGDVDWLLHADVDEFLLSDVPVHDVLDTLPEGTLTLRVRPMEALAPAPDHSGPLAFKCFIPPGPERIRTVRRIYPRYGEHLKGGFLSHVAGKTFLRTGLDDVTMRIHNAQSGEVVNPAQVETGALRLAHLHAIDWTAWKERFDYRHRQGAYRAELKPRGKPEGRFESLHDFFNDLLDREGDAGLRAFFDEVCADTPDLRARLATEGYFTLQDLDLLAKRVRHFPDNPPATPSV